MNDLDIKVVDSLIVDLNQVDYITNAETQNSIDVFIEDQEQFESFIDTQDTSVLCTEESSKLTLINTLKNKQNKTDSKLSTASKTIVGAINELNTTLSNITNSQDGDLVRIWNAVDRNEDNLNALDSTFNQHIEDFDKLEKGLNQHYIEYASLGDLVLEIENSVAILKQKGIYKIVEVLPEEGDANIIYLVPRQDALDKNIKDEYMWIDGKWESVGTTSIDLADYTTKKEFNEVKQENVDLLKRLEEIELILPAAL